MSGFNHILTGFTVLDFTQVASGPSATRLMVEMGAEVIKIELAPRGDMARSLPVMRRGRSAYYVQQNRGKKSVCVDLKATAGKALVHELIGHADVVIENFSPGVAERLGIGWPVVHALNPRAVMCSISAFGQQGPLATLPGFDYIAQAYAGVTAMIGEPDGPPALPMLALGDVSAGVHAACAIGYALLERERGGPGRHLDISILDAYFHCHELNVQVHSLTGQVPTRSGHMHYAVCPIGLFKAKERYVCLVVLDAQWPQLCRAIGRPELATDERYAGNAARVARSREVIMLIEDWIAAQPSSDAVLRAMADHHVPCAPVLNIEEVVNTPHVRERETARRIDDAKLGTLTVPGMPLRFSGLPLHPPLAAAYLGEHNMQVLCGKLGYAEERVRELHANGVLHANPDT